MQSTPQKQYVVNRNISDGEILLLRKNERIWGEKREYRGYIMIYIHSLGRGFPAYYFDEA